MLVENKYKYVSKGGFFRDMNGTLRVDAEHNIGVTTSGNNDNVYVHSLSCQVSVREPMPYFTNGHLDPFVTVKWTIIYNVFSRSKGRFGTRKMRDSIDESFVNDILGVDTRIALENELLIDMHKRCSEGVDAIETFHRLTGRKLNND